ncbi:MAG: response regulator [Anaerolineales bacterium]|jgi:two-component system chemotaxis response regulator CheY|nr:MAG: response regulator [Anaerolineales bacterium]
MEERMRAVWIVDDDDEMSHAVKLMLQLLDSTVEIFRDARSAAKRLLAGDRPDLIVLDINMPEVSGIDFLEFLRMRNDLKEIPVVMLSSETTDIQVDEAMRIGANAFVFKPVTLEELEEAMQIALPKL